MCYLVAIGTITTAKGRYYDYVLGLSVCLCVIKFRKQNFCKIYTGHSLHSALETFDVVVVITFMEFWSHGSDSRLYGG